MQNKTQYNSTTKIRNFNSSTVLILPQNVVDFTYPLKEADVPELTSRCLVLPSEGRSNLSISRIDKGYARGISINETKIGNIADLPDEVENTILIVPSIVYISLYRSRKDLYVIDEPIRTDRGRIVACRSLSRPRYVTDDNHFKSIAEKLERSYSRLLIAINNSEKLSKEELLAVILKEELAIQNSVINLNKVVCQEF